MIFYSFWIFFWRSDGRYHGYWKALNHVFNCTMIQGVKFRVDTTNSQVCSLRFDLFHEVFWFWKQMLKTYINEAVDSTIIQISSSCAERWSSFVCSLRFDLFHKVFWFWKKMFKKFINEAVDSTIIQISSSCAERWSSFVCSLRFDPPGDNPTGGGSGAASPR